MTAPNTDIEAAVDALMHEPPAAMAVAPSLSRLFDYSALDLASAATQLRGLAHAAIAHVLGNGPAPRLSPATLAPLAALLRPSGLTRRRRRRATAWLRRPLRYRVPDLPVTFSDLELTAAEIARGSSLLDRLHDALRLGRRGVVAGDLVLGWVARLAWTEPQFRLALAAQIRERIAAAVVLHPAIEVEASLSDDALWAVIALVAVPLTGIHRWRPGQRRLQGAFLAFARHRLDAIAPDTPFDGWIIAEAVLTAGGPASAGARQAVDRAGLATLPRYVHAFPISAGQEKSAAAPPATAEGQALTRFASSQF